MDNFDNLAFRNINKVDFASIEKEYKKKNIDFECYKKQKVNNLNQFASGKIKIYLDLKYLIKIRESFTEKNTSIYKKIFFRLKELVDNGKVICPFSDCILDEILKQTDLISRNNTARILDILSKNVSLKPLLYILKSEFLNVIEFYTGHKLKKSLYWDYPISTIGDLDFNLSNTNDSDTNLIKIQYFELMITQTIQELISTHKNRNCSIVSSIAESIFSSPTFNTEGKTFNKITENEIKSVLISIGEELKMPSQSALEIIQKIKIEDIERIAPSIYVFCSLHAEMINNSSKRYEKNDYYDVIHCSLAIPNCDYLFTENSFMHRTKNVLKMDMKYDIKIESKPENIFSILNNL